MDIVEGEEYSDVIVIELRSERNLDSIRQLMGWGRASDHETQYTVKDFLKKAVRYNWSKIAQADRLYWYQLIDIVIDYSDAYSTIKFVTEKENTNA
jgi:hypothetical protein